MQKLGQSQATKTKSLFSSRKIVGSWGSDSVCKVFAIPAQGPEFGAPTPTLKVDTSRRHPTPTSGLHTHAHTC